MEAIAWFALWTFATPLFVKSHSPSSVDRKKICSKDKPSDEKAKRGEKRNMVVHKIFGVERDLDIPQDVFPTDEELKKMEESMPGCEHGWFNSVYKDAKLHYRKFVPPNGAKPKAIVIFMHGISTHGGNSMIMPDSKRKLNMALRSDALLKEGYALYAFDLYGHGFSEGVRWWIPETWENNLNDFIKFCNLVAGFHDDDIPMYLMGESYGSNLCIHVAREFQNNPGRGPKSFDGIMVTAPAIIGDLPPYPVYFILRYVLAPCSPQWRPSFMPNPISPERIWRDPKVIEQREALRVKDTMVDGSGIPFRLGTAVNLIKALEEARMKSIPGLKQPYCIVHGTCDYGVPMAGSEFMWENTSTPDDDRVFHKIEGAYHDLLSEPEPVAEQAMQHCVDWIKKRIASKAKK